MPSPDRRKLVRDAYGAYESGDRRVIEELLPWALAGCAAVERSA